MAIPDLSALLNNAIGFSAGMTYGNARSGGLVFSSLLRDLAQAQSELAESMDRIQVDDSGFGHQLLVGGATATDFFKGATQRSDNAQGAFTLPLGPNRVIFKQPKRFNKVDTREGSVIFHYTNSLGQNNDLLTMTVSGSIGNIDPRGSLATENLAEVRDAGFANSQRAEVAELDHGAVAKLLGFHNLYLWTNEPNLIANAYENVWHIDYASTILPQTIRFSGFPNQVLDWPDLADKPNEIEYSFDFTVTEANPPLHELLDLMVSAVINTRLEGLATAEAFGPNARPIIP